jgi:hypothetical protein
MQSYNKIAYNRVCVRVFIVVGTYVLHLYCVSKKCKIVFFKFELVDVNN